MGQLFKNAVFGGFKKREVVEYIDKQKKDYEAQVSSLRSETLLLKKNASEFDASLAEKDTQIAEIQAQFDELSEKLAASEALAKNLQHETDLAQKQTAQTQKQYSELKEYIADIELSAYKRAREVQTEAATTAAQVTQDIIAVRDNVSPVAEQAHAQVKQAEEAFSGFKTKIAQITGEIDELVIAINTIEKMQPNEPLPPEENPSLKTLQDILNRVKQSGQFK